MSRAKDPSDQGMRDDVRGPKVHRVRPMDRLGRYVIREFLGKGGMGRVYRADGPYGPCALKLIHPEHMRKGDFLQRFRMEAGAGKRVVHPNVIRTFGCEVVRWRGEEQALLVMEYVQGKTLYQLGREQPAGVSESRLREIAEGTTRGLAAIHEAGVIHRDLKPENLMLTTDGQIKIMDLGVARLKDDEVRLSRTGHFVGSLLFAAPEQLRERADRCGAPADLYALGLVLYILATGQHPFPAGTAGEIIHAHLELLAMPVRERHPGVSPFMEAVIATLLEKEPERRFPDASVLREILEAGESSDWWRRWRAQTEPEEDDTRIDLGVARRGPVRGRARELRELSRAYGQACRGRGRTILVTGEDGVGKTRLLDAFLAAEDLGRDNVITAIAPADTWEHPFAACRQALDMALTGAEPSRELERLLADTPGLVEPLVNFLAAPSGVEISMAPDTLGRAFARAFTGLVAGRPRVLIMEDLDRISGEDQAVFLRLASASRRLPLLLVGTSHAELVPGYREALLRLPASRAMPLHRLDGASAERLLADLVGTREVASELAHEILPLAGGNPLFLGEVVDGLLRSGILVPDESGVLRVVAGRSLASVPRSLQAAIASQLAAVPQVSREVLEAASIQGVAFDPRLLALVLGRHERVVREALLPLAAEPAMVRESGRVYEFVPSSVRQVVREGLSPARRTRLELATARALEHRLRPGDTTERNELLPRVTRHALWGGDLALATAHLFEAIAVLRASLRSREALDLVEAFLERAEVVEPTLRLSAMVQRVELLQHLGPTEAEREALTTLTCYARDYGLELPVPALAAMGRRALAEGDVVRAERHLRILERTARQNEDVSALAAAYRDQAQASALRGDTEETRRLLERSLDAARATEDAAEELMTCCELARHFERAGQMSRVYTHLHGGLLLALQTDDEQRAARIHARLGQIAIRWGRFRVAQVHLDRQLQLADATGDRLLTCRGERSLASLLLRRGRLTDAQQHLERAHRMAREAGLERDGIAVTLDLARVALCSGNGVDLMRHAMRALSRAQHTRTPHLEAEALTLAGRAAEECGDLDESLDWFEQALARCDAHPFAGAELQPLLGIARIWRRRGRLDQLGLPLERARQTADGLALRGPQLVAEAMAATSMESPVGSVRGLLVRYANRLTVFERLRVYLELHAATGDPLHAHLARSEMRRVLVGLDTDESGPVVQRYSLYREVADAAGIDLYQENVA